MEKSTYSEMLDKMLPGVILSAVKKLETTEDGKPAKYRFLEMTREKYSIDGKWASLIAKYSHVKADVVAMDSPLPLKSRKPIQSATGDIPKHGIRKSRNESRLKELQKLDKLGKLDEFKQELMSDPVACTMAMYESIEYALLYGLSNGAIEANDENNVGTTNRLTFGYLEENQFEANWDDPATSKSLDDIENLVDKSNGSVKILMMDRPTVNKLRNSAQVRSAVFSNGGGVVVDGKSLQRPSISALNEYLATEYGLVIDVVARTVKAEKNGVESTLTPWKEGMIVAIPDLYVADLVYTEPAEENAKVDGVNYTNPKKWMLLSVYRENTPTLSETTAVQGMVYPILNNVGGIYTIDTKKKVETENNPIVQTKTNGSPANPLDGNLTEAKSYVNSIEDKEELQELLDYEVSNKNRLGVVDLINKKLA